MKNARGVSLSVVSLSKIRLLVGEKQILDLLLPFSEKQKDNCIGMSGYSSKWEKQVVLKYLEPFVKSKTSQAREVPTNTVKELLPKIVETLLSN